jgi:hypothetical protein
LNNETEEAAMQSPAFAWAMMGLGVILIIVTGRADQLGVGRYPGFGWLQGLGVAIGVVVLLAGLYLRGKTKPSP